MNFKFLFLILILRQVMSTYTLIYEGFGQNSFGNEGWNILRAQSASFNTVCGTTNIFGGLNTFNYQTVITNLFSLPPHSILKFSLNFWKFQNWGTNDKVVIFIDGDIAYLDVPVVTSNPCGELTFIEQQKNHNFKSATILIYTSISTTTGFWGISDFKLYVQRCPPGCSVCEISDITSQNCINWDLAYESLIQLDLSSFSMEGWTVTNSENGVPISECLNIPMLCGYDKCAQNSEIYTEIVLPSHTQIKIQFKFFKIDSWDNEIAILKIDNQEQWRQAYTPDQGYCICGAQWAEFINNIELNLFHTSQNLNFLLTSNLNEQPNTESLGLRDVQIFINTRACQLYNYECCGDQIKQQGEDCDDGNTIPFDGCFNCKYSCIDGCLNCVNGLCLLCKDDWIHNQFDNSCNYQFQQTSSRNITTIKTLNPFPCNQDCEICIDQICLKCSIRSQLILGQCRSMECEEGLTFYDDYCATICGDGKVSSDYEECDDGNDIPYDGCYNCSYQCHQNCQNCQKGNCIDKCQYGYYFSDQDCISICGDQIIVGLEECDDGNDNEYDGCNKCKYQCPQYCNECINGKCQQCQINFVLNARENICTNICGDGILTIPFEKCDDFNDQAGDGCSNQCEIELQWVCKENEECVYSKLSQFQVQFIEQINEYQYVSLYFTQQMKRNKNSTLKYMNFINVTSLENDQFNYSIIAIHEASFTLGWVNYQLEILIRANYRPNLQIQLMETLYDSEDLPMMNDNQTVQLNIPKFMSESQVQSSEKLQTSQKNMLYSLGGIGVVLIISGFGNIVWSNLDMLQEVSYLRFINVDFPQNIMIFFESAEMISLQSYTINFGFFENYAFLNQQTTGKFKFYQINASLAFNIQSLILSFGALFLFYQIAKFVTIIFNHMNGKYLEQNFRISNLIHKISFRSNKIRFQTLKYGFDEILQKSTWSLLFMVFIQLNYNSLEQSILAYILLICYLNTMKFELNLLIYKLKQMSLMGVLVFFQENQQLQVILITLIYGSYLICFLKFRENKLEYYKKLILECSLLSFVVSSNFYFNESLIHLSYEQKVAVGWFSINLLIFIILFYITCDSFKFFQAFIIAIKQRFATTVNQKEGSGVIK